MIKRLLRDGILVLSLSLVSTQVYSQSLVTANGLVYSIYGNTAEINSGEASKLCGEVVIPATVRFENKDYDVTALGEKCFANCSGITSVVLPNTITTLKDKCFECCDRLSLIIIPNSVSVMDGACFYGCEQLDTVWISDLEAWCNIRQNHKYSNPLTYGAKLFIEGELVSNLIIPETVTTISDLSFASCKSITSVDIPNSVKSIGTNSFAYCPNLQSVTIDCNTPIVLGDFCFADSPVQTLYVPNGTRALYAESPQWKDIPNIVDDSMFAILNITVTDPNISAER